MNGEVRSVFRRASRFGLFVSIGVFEVVEEAFLVFWFTNVFYVHLMSMPGRRYWFTNGIQRLFGNGLLSLVLLTHANSILQWIHDVNN